MFRSHWHRNPAFDTREHKLSMAYNDHDNHVYMFRWSVEYSEVRTTYVLNCLRYKKALKPMGMKSEVQTTNCKERKRKREIGREREKREKVSEWV